MLFVEKGLDVLTKRTSSRPEFVNKAPLLFYSTVLRPLSSASLNSEVSNATTVETKASVNDILSMAADAENMSVYSLDSHNQAMSFGALMKMSPAQPQVSLLNFLYSGNRVLDNRSSDKITYRTNRQ